MRPLERLAVDARYVIDLPGFLRHPFSLEDARSTVERQLQARAESFLDILERGVYAHPRSPYYRLLSHAGVELGDVQRHVRQDGLEATLGKLYDTGVYVTSEEMKGRQPIRRNGLEIPVSTADFDNPLGLKPHLVSTSSGSTGQGTNVQASLKSISAASIDILLGNISQFGDRPLGFWSAGDVAKLLWYAKAGRPLATVFYSDRPRWSSFAIRQRLILLYTRFVARLLNYSIPRPEIVGRDEAPRIAKWLAEMTAGGIPAAMLCESNPAVRVCIAAKENGLDISGTLFSVGGEPYTPGKAAVLASAGASALVSYAMTEVGGVVGRSCANAIEIDDVHFFTHRLALIQRDREVSPGQTVGALIYTTVHPDNLKLMLNADSGDYATMTNRECGCLMGQAGLNTHLQGVRSYQKLTSEGNTFIGSRLYELVEEVLPALFGGGINDYQLVEEEQESGLSKVSIVVSPRVGPIDEQAVIAAVLENLESSHSHAGGSTMVEMWRQGSNLQVVRREPYATQTMKVLPLRVVSKSRGTQA